MLDLVRTRWRLRSSPGLFRPLVRQLLMPARITGFLLGTDVGAIFVGAFGLADSHSKRQELLIEFFKVLKLINEVVRCFCHLYSRRFGVVVRFATGSCWMLIMLCFRVNLQQNSPVKLNISERG